MVRAEIEQMTAAGDDAIGAPGDAAGGDVIIVGSARDMLRGEGSHLRGERGIAVD